MSKWTRRTAARCRALIAGLSIVSGGFAETSEAAAQELYGSVVGVVRDAQSGVLPGAAVVIVNRNTGLKREATTNAEGGFTFANLPGGSYDVHVTLTGFREAVRSNVPLAVGQISRVDISLEVGGVAEVVEVSSAVQLLQTDKADTRTELKPTEITNLPLNQYRNYQMLLNLVPGSQPGYNAFSETLLPQGTLNMIMGGQDGTQQTTRNDGTNLVNAFLPAAQVYIPPAETIESVNVVTGSMDAESGGASGAAVSVITKSGTNQLRGSAFVFYNNDKLNATPYYFGVGTPPRKLPLNRQTMGGTLGGPLRRNQLFYFGSYEGYFSELERFAFYSVPDAALRRGDFSNALNANGTLQQIYDPASANLSAATAGRTQFPGNVIPSGRIHPIAREILDTYYPQPNIQGSGAGQPDEQLSRSAAGHDRSSQRGRQDQLEPNGHPPDLGQGEPHGRAHQRSSRVPVSDDVRGRRAHRRLELRRGANMDARFDDDDGRLHWPGDDVHQREVAGYLHGHARSGARHSRHQRSGSRR